MGKNRFNQKQKLEVLKDELKLLQAIGTLEYYKKQDKGLKLLKPKSAQVKATAPELVPGLTPVDDAGNFNIDWMEVAADEVERLNQAISQSFNDLAINMVDAFATMAVAGEGFQPGNLLMQIANVAENLGKLAISTGMTTIAIKKSLSSLQGGVAIAAGIALIVLAKAVKAQAAAMASGGSVSPNVSQFSPGSNYDRTTTRAYGETAREREIKIDVEVHGNLDGEVIRLANKRAEIRHGLSS